MNKDLADVFGNWSTARSASPRTFGAACRRAASRASASGRSRRRSASAWRSCATHHEALEFRRAAAETRAIWARANAYLQDAAPWTGFTSNPARAAVVTRTALNLIRLSAVVAWSIVPDIAGRVLAAFGEQDEIPRWPGTSRGNLVK